ncbi:hypothetical protein ACOMHN_012997 [Nucella lapillus]
MNEAQKRAIQIKWTFLIDHLDAGGSTTLLDHLYEKNVITLHQKERVTAQQLSKDKVTTLLEIMQRKSPDAFYELLAAMQSSGQGHIAEVLQQAFQPQGDGQDRQV